MTLETKITELQQQVGELTTKNQELMDYFTGARDDIESRLQNKEQQVENWLIEADGHKPFVRATPDQFGELDASIGNFKGWRKAPFNIELSLYREIITGIHWDERDAEEKEILNSMGLSGQRFFQPNIRVIRMTWTGKNSYGSHNENTTAQTIYPKTVILQDSYTLACYAKLVSGEISGNFLGSGDLAVNSDWGLCGVSAKNQKPGSYRNAHPNAKSDSGEVLIIWPALVHGYMNLDRENPRWRYYGHTSLIESTDTSI